MMQDANHNCPVGCEVTPLLLPQGGHSPICRHSFEFGSLGLAHKSYLFLSMQRIVTNIVSVDLGMINVPKQFPAHDEDGKAGDDGLEKQ